VSQKPEAPPVLVAADDADVAAVRAALGPSALVARFEGDPRGGLGPVSVVVSSTVAKAGAGAAAWLALAPQGGPAPALVLLADVADERAVAQWLDDGGHDWVFREHLGVLPAVLERLRSEREAREQLEQRLRASTAALVQVARSPRFKSDDLDGVLREIAEAAARGLASARCGVWLFDDNHAVLRQMAQFDARSNTHTKGFALSVHAHDAHFAALRSQRLVATVHPQADARPQQPDGEHAQPVAFTSTIDVSVQLGGELIGLLRIEYFGAPHRLSASEEAFATAMTDVLSLILEGSERSQFESTLLKGERRFRDLFQHTTDALVLYRVALDGNVYFEDINPAAEVASGLKRDDVIGRQAHEVFAPRTSQHMKERYAEAIRTRAPIAYDESLELPAGQRAFSTVIVPLPDETGRIDRLAAVARDMTAQREAEARQRTLEAQLTEAQKNEALVRLASHIAHDVNNLLTVVMANAQRLESLPGRPAEVAQAILQATNRGRELTQQVLTFSRRRPPERKRLELGPMVRETLKLLEVTAPDVMMRVELPARPVVVQGDSSQLRQVVTNLCTNALTAMAGSKGAKLTLRLDLIELDYAFAQRHPPLQAGRWARLVVEDTGESLDDAARRRIFEPFFSSGAQGTRDRPGAGGGAEHRSRARRGGGGRARADPRHAVHRLSACSRGGPRATWRWATPDAGRRSPGHGPRLGAPAGNPGLPNQRLR
jgi:PAS domain S-box-containing protein